VSLVRLHHVFPACLALTLTGRVALAQAFPPAGPPPPPGATPIAIAPPCDPAAPSSNSPDYRRLPRSALPPTLRYRAEEPIPFGYELKMEPRWGFVIAGVVTFGATYLPSALLGGALAGGPKDDGFGLAMIIPLAGPIVSLRLETGAKSVVKGLAIVNSVFQLGGTGLAMVGLFAKEEYLEQSAPKSAKWLSPAVFVGPQSVALRWQF
jgi:hypothetical protein